SRVARRGSLSRVGRRGGRPGWRTDVRPWSRMVTRVDGRSDLPMDRTATLAQHRGVAPGPNPDESLNLASVCRTGGWVKTVEGLTGWARRAAARRLRRA